MTLGFLTLTLTHTHRHTQTQALLITDTLIFTHAQTHTHTHTCTLIHTLTHSGALSHTHFLAYTLSRTHTRTYRHPVDSPGRVISPTQRPLPDNTNNTHKTQTSLPPAGIESAIPASERLQTHALDRAGTGTGSCKSVTYTQSNTEFVNQSFDHKLILKIGI